MQLYIIKLLFFFAAINFFAGCNECYYNEYLSFTNYDVNKYNKHRTANGISVYSNQNVRLGEIERQTIELEKCLGIHIKRRCFAILIPDDWFYSEATRQELLPYAAPVRLCNMKGAFIPNMCEGIVYPTDDCPLTCNWRVALQDNYLIVTPPGLILYKAELARLVTGVNNVWTSENITRCL